MNDNCKEKSLKFSQIECDKMEWMKFDVQRNGYFQCQSKTFEEGSECLYKCRAGWIPGKSKVMTCLAKKNKNDETISYHWDRNENSFDCVKSIR